MKILITKGATADTIEVCRSDGSGASTSFLHKGPIPHDVVHFFVEIEIGMRGAFWGLIAGGRHPEEIGALAKAAGHASAARRRTPDAHFVAVIQAERVVECFEADLWCGGNDPITFISTIDAGCQQSLVPTLVIEGKTIERIRHRLRQFRDGWSALPVGGSCSLEWPDE